MGAIGENWKWALGWATLFTGIQIGVSIALAPHQEGLKGAYQRLDQWDSAHYIEIIDHGYRVPQGRITAEDVHSSRANIAFFPAFPEFGSLLHRLTHLSSWASILLEAQFFCLLFWFQFFLLLVFWQIPPRLILAGAFSLALYPASFFLVFGYSESLFLSALIGLILWAEISFEGNSKRSGILAAACGFVLSGTRLVGIPLFPYALMRGSPSNSVSALVISLATALGGALFFLWCQLQFGVWDIYIRLQQLGWGNYPDYWALFYPSTYLPHLFFEDTRTSVCRASNLFVLVVFGLLIHFEYRSGWKTIRKRLPLYFVSITLFFISVSGKAHASMDSMVRYNLPVIMIETLLMISILNENKNFLTFFNQAGWKRRLVILGYAVALGFQIWMIHQITKGAWVA